MSISGALIVIIFTLKIVNIITWGWFVVVSSIFWIPILVHIVVYALAGLYVTIAAFLSYIFG